MLAWVLAVALCLFACVCLSQVGVLSKGVNGVICFLAWRVFFDQSYTVLKGNSGIYNNEGILPSGTFS